MKSVPGRVRRLEHRIAPPEQEAHPTDYSQRKAAACAQRRPIRRDPHPRRDICSATDVVDRSRTGAYQANNGNNYMNEKQQDVAHRGMVSKMARIQPVL
jgi:hypothetical protein